MGASLVANDGYSIWLTV